MEVATVTDPAYLILDNILEIYPEPTSSQVGRVHHVIYPTVDASAVSTIANFPDEAEYLVVLYACIKAVQQLLATEEDIELYSPMLAQLKDDYSKGLAQLVN